MSRIRSILRAGALAAALIAANGAARADFSLDLGTTFNGISPTSSAPWLTATFHTVSTGEVVLTLQAHLDVVSEYIDAFTFNVDPSIPLGNLAFAIVPTTDPTVRPVNISTQDAQNLQGAGVAGRGFDVGLAWSNSNANGGAARFSGTDTVTVTITDATDGITADSFRFINTGSAGAHAGAHVEGIPIIGGTSSGAIMDSLPVPEPSSLALLMGGAVAAVVARRRGRILRPA